jgi:LPXTG-motif cell wall-anchored protein
VKTVLGGSPKTGDSTDILTPVVLLSVFVLALAIVVVYHKKKGER